MRRRAMMAAAGFVLASAMSAVIAPTPVAAEGEIRIEKLANGEPADSAPGPSVPTGTRVRYRYVIKVSSNQPLYDFVVTDTSGVTPDCDTDGDGKPDGYNGHPGPISQGSFVCLGSEIAGSPGVTYGGIARVKAYNIDVSASFEAQDVAHYTAVAAPTSAPPTTKTPTTAPPTTKAPTTASTSPPTTRPPTTKAPTTASTAPPTTASTSTSSTSPTTASTDSTGTDATERETSSTIDLFDLSTPESDAASTGRTDGGRDTENNDGDARSSGEVEPSETVPGELAFTDEDRQRGLSLWWALAAFALGGGIALAVTRFRESENEPTPGQ